MNAKPEFLVFFFCNLRIRYYFLLFANPIIGTKSKIITIKTAITLKRGNTHWWYQIAACENIKWMSKCIQIRIRWFFWCEFRILWCLTIVDIKFVILFLQCLLISITFAVYCYIFSIQLNSTKTWNYIVNFAIFLLLILIFCFVVFLFVNFCNLSFLVFHFHLLLSTFTQCIFIYMLNYYQLSLDKQMFCIYIFIHCFYTIDLDVNADHRRMID